MIQIAIRLGLLALLIYWSFIVLQPFIPVLAWSVVLAVALYPAFDWLSAHLGHRPRTAAALITIAELAVFLGPATWLGLGLVDGMRGISDQLTSGDLTIPSPPQGIRDWPLIGTTLHEFWQMASGNLQAALRQLAPYLKPLAGPVLAIAGSVGTGTIKFLLAVVIAGFLFPSGPQFVASIRTMLTRIVPQRSADFLALQQFAPAALQRDLAVDHDIAAMRELERVVGILLDQKHRQLVALIERANGGENLLHQERRETERGLVEENKARTAHQRTADRQHLLLATRERAATLVRAIAQARK